MKENSAFPGELADLLDRLNGPDFVIGVHHTDEPSLRANGSPDNRCSFRSSSSRLTRLDADAGVALPLALDNRERLLEELAKLGRQLGAGICSLDQDA